MNRKKKVGKDSKEIHMNEVFSSFTDYLGGFNSKMTALKISGVYLIVGAFWILLSDIQLLQQNFTDKVMKTLSQAEIEPRYIELEITESVLIESYDGIKDKLKELRSKGIKIALDDCGTGYSSLSYLIHIPINTLKIDKTFIDTIASDKDGTSLTNMIILIGRKLGLSIVAEGVETEKQLEYLRKHNCHKIQGYYFSKPLPQKELLELLDKNR